MRDEGVSEEELADVKTYINGSFPLRLDSSGEVASILVGIQRSGSASTISTAAPASSRR